MPQRLYEYETLKAIQNYASMQVANLLLAHQQGNGLQVLFFTGSLKSTYNNGALNSSSWTNDNSVINSVTFKALATNNIDTITANYSVMQPKRPIAKVNSIEELKTLASETKATLALTDDNEGGMARVLYVLGAGNTQEAYVRDTTGAVCSYGISPNIPFISNQHVTGQITGECAVGNGIPCFKAIPNMINTSLFVIVAPVAK